MGLLPAGGPYVYSVVEDWSAVLRECVHDHGVDYLRLSKNPQRLHRFVALLAVTGPTTTPEQFAGPSEKIAYWINAHNACVLEAVMQRFPVSTMHDLSLPRLRHEYRFVVDSAPQTLAEMERHVLELSDGDVRIILALTWAARGGPRLLARPFDSDGLSGQLDAASARTLDDLNILRVDHAHQQVLVWPAIIRRQVDFEAYWGKRQSRSSVTLLDVLAGMSSTRRRAELERTVGYHIRPIPFSRRLDQATASTSDQTS